MLMVGDVVGKSPDVWATVCFSPPAIGRATITAL
jgi:hypothetical protein